MKKLKGLLKKYQHELIISLSLLTVIFFTTFNYDLPFKSYGDIWAHIAMVGELTKPFGEIGDPYFDYGTKDPHNGPYFVFIAKISEITGINFIWLMEFFGIFGVVLLFLGTLQLYKILFPERKEKIIDKYVLAITFFLLWESYKLSYAGYFSLADIGITSTFPHIPVLACFMFGIAIAVNSLNYQLIQKKVNKKILKHMAVLTLIGSFVLLNHQITGMAFFYTYGMFVIYYFVKEKSFKIKYILFINIVVPVFTVLICLLWPYYSFLAPFNSLQTIHTGQPLVSIFEVKNWLFVAGIGALALVNIYKTKNKLVLFWFITMLLIVSSYAYPVRISSYWRFFPFLLIPIFFMFTEWVVNLKNTTRTFVIFFLLLFGFTSFVNKVDTIGYRKPITESSYSFLNLVPDNKLIFSDPETSYLFAGLSSHPVLAIKENHWNPSNWNESNNRYQDSIAFWESPTGTGSLFVLDKYNIEYILFNKRIARNYSNQIILIAEEYNVQEIYQNEGYLLISINNVKNSN